jgi:hypothetical protein
MRQRISKGEDPLPDSLAKNSGQPRRSRSDPLLGHIAEIASKNARAWQEIAEKLDI